MSNQSIKAFNTFVEMNVTLEKIETSLNEFLTYDWLAFNHLEMSEQNKEWSRLKNNFNNLLIEAYAKEKVDFDKIYALLASYSSRIEQLPIIGKYYVNVNKRLLNAQLIDFIIELEYQEVKKIENPDCECQILSRFRRDPEIDNLKEIGIINDAYYFPKLYSCKNCGFKWTSHISDDSIGETIFEKFEIKDEKRVEYCN